MEGLRCLFLFNMCLKLLLTATASKPSKTYVTYLTPWGFLYHLKHKMPHNFYYFTGHAKCSYKVSPPSPGKIYTANTANASDVSGRSRMSEMPEGIEGQKNKSRRCIRPSKVWKVSDGNKHWHLDASTLLITHVRTHKCHQGQQNCP